MSPAQNDYEAIGAYVRQHLGEWLQEQSLSKPPHVYEIELRERMVRVEEALKNQMALMQQGFDLMGKRFEQVDKRFEQVDKRFERADKRFEEMRQDMNRGFEILTKRIDRFMFWSFGLTVAATGLIIAMMKMP